MNQPTSFLEELEALINKYSLENQSNTPDFILARYLVDSLGVFTDAVNWREAHQAAYKTEAAPLNTTDITKGA